MSEPPPEDVVVSVRDLCKHFRLPQEQVHTLKERVLHPTRRGRFDRLQAVHELSFEVRRGEFFGIVGRNGSGKSTLMKCLSGIYRAESGEMWLRGRMAPFIELGVGFNPDLTAHDNVLINAVMLGLTPTQARERYASILDFADLHEFADLKLKNYSSGMQVRLAFAVMVHVDADLLLIDEVLAVGDAAFQQKCYDVLNEARHAGSTILLVTHDMDQVQRFCDRALLLDRGELVTLGDPAQVARRYMQLNFARGEDVQTVQALIAGEGDGRAAIVDAWAQTKGKRTEVVEQRVVTQLCMRVLFREDTQDPVFGLAVSDEQHRRVFAGSTEWSEKATGSYAAGEEIDVAMAFDNWFAPGRYFISPQVTYPGNTGRAMALREDAYSFVVTGSRSGGGLVDIPHSFHLTPVPGRVAMPG